MNNQIRKLLTFVLNKNEKLKGTYVNFEFSAACKSIYINVMDGEDDAKHTVIFSDYFYMDWETGKHSIKEALPRIYSKLNEL